MRFKAGEIAKNIAADVSEKHDADAGKTEKCLMRRCLREVRAGVGLAPWRRDGAFPPGRRRLTPLARGQVTRTMAEQRDNPCHPAVMNRRARVSSRGLRNELREEYGPPCRQQCKQYVKQDRSLSETDCVANCTYFKATNDVRYDSALDQARFRAAAECAVANHWNTLAKCMISTCGLDVPKPGKPRKPVVELR